MATFWCMGSLLNLVEATTMFSCSGPLKPPWFEEQKYCFEQHKYCFEQHKYRFEQHKYCFEEHKCWFEEQKCWFEEQKCWFDEQKCWFKEQQCWFKKDKCCTGPTSTSVRKPSCSWPWCQSIPYWSHSKRGWWVVLAWTQQIWEKKNSDQIFTRWVSMTLTWRWPTSHW